VRAGGGGETNENNGAERGKAFLVLSMAHGWLAL
jgi:hypothetical protein